MRTVFFNVPLFSSPKNEVSLLVTHHVKHLQIHFVENLCVMGHIFE